MLCNEVRKHISLKCQTLWQGEKFPGAALGPYIHTFAHAQAARRRFVVPVAFVNSLARWPFPRFGLWPPFDVLEQNFVFVRPSASVRLGWAAYDRPHSTLSIF